MKILVCVKQVPDTTEIKIDPVTNTLIRAGVPSIVNPFDACALEVAARIKDVTPDTEITVLSMGPMQAKEALTECLAVGADKAYLCSDRVFGGSDTLATSYILASAIAAIEEKEGKFDLIFSGKQAIDGDTGQVGPEIAAHMGLAQVTYASEVKMCIRDRQSIFGRMRCRSFLLFRQWGPPDFIMTVWLRTLWKREKRSRCFLIWCMKWKQSDRLWALPLM